MRDLTDNELSVIAGSGGPSRIISAPILCCLSAAACIGAASVSQFFKFCKEHQNDDMVAAAIAGGCILLGGVLLFGSFGYMTGVLPWKRTFERSGVKIIADFPPETPLAGALVKKKQI